MYMDMLSTICRCFRELSEVPELYPYEYFEKRAYNRIIEDLAAKHGMSPADLVQLRTDRMAHLPQTFEFKCCTAEHGTFYLCDFESHEDLLSYWAEGNILPNSAGCWVETFGIPLVNVEFVGLTQEYSA
tara:strand:+ start:714 stop:1100 length:387 start_codon:yes stop_codon:yes gene_type:complete